MTRLRLTLAAPLLLAAAAPQDRSAERELMVLTVANMAETAGARSRRIDPAVLGALRQVHRHLFVPDEARRFAYENRPLPIGHEQTISQPYIVALMTDLLRPRPQDVVLEIGTGSGYQAAILSRLVGRVQSIEIVEQLAARAASLLARLGYSDVEVRAGDGYRAGRTGRPSTGSSSPPEPITSRGPWSTSSARAAVW